MRNRGFTQALTVDIEYDPGATYSDHSSFWNNGYRAVLGIEQEVWTNPYCHQTSDLLSNYLAYFPFGTNSIKGAIATVAYLAEPTGLTGISGDEGFSAGPGIAGISPNPAHSTLTINLTQGFACVIQVSLFDISGRMVLSGMYDASSGSVDHIPTASDAPEPNAESDTGDSSYQMWKVYISPGTDPSC